MTFRLVLAPAVALLLLLAGATSASAAIAPPSILFGPAAFEQSESARFEWRADRSTVTDCRHDGATVACGETVARLTGLAEGAHTFAVRFVGPTEASAWTERSWTVDRTAPALPVLTTAPGLAMNVRDVSFAWTEVEPGSTATCTLTGRASSPCDETVTYAALADGYYGFSMGVRDAAGNVAVMSRSFQVDTSAPAAPYARFSLSGEFADGNVIFEWRPREPGISVTCTLNGVPSDVCSYSAAAIYAAQRDISFAFIARHHSLLPVGELTWVVVATDAAGNRSSPAVVTVPASRSYFNHLPPPDDAVNAAPGPGLEPARALRASPSVKRLKNGVYRFAAGTLVATGRPGVRYAWQLGTCTPARAKRVFGKPFARRATVIRRLRDGRTYHVRLTVTSEGEKHSQTVVVRVPRSAPR